jgi:hypothetical protein
LNYVTIFKTFRIFEYQLNETTMTTAQKLTQKLEAAKSVNARLVAQIGEGNGATGLTATFAVNAAKDLAKVMRQIKNAQVNGSITNDEYAAIMNF